MREERESDGCIRKFVGGGERVTYSGAAETTGCCFFQEQARYFPQLQIAQPAMHLLAKNASFQNFKSEIP